MNESRPDQKSPFRPMMIILALIIVVPLLLCGGLLTWFFGRQSLAARDLQVRSQQLQQDGKPIDNKTLQTFHESITSDRLTRQWTDAIDVVTSEEFREQASKMPLLGMVPNVPKPGSPWPEQDQVLAFLKQWEPLRESIHEMAQAELAPDSLPMRHAISFDGLDTILRGTQESRTLARLIALEFDVALYQKDGDRAFKCIQSSRGLQRSFDGEPILVSQLIRIAIGMVTNGMLRRGLEQDLLSEQQLAEINQQIPTFKDTHGWFQLAIQGERAFGLPVFTDPDKASEMMGADEGSKVAEIFTKLRSVDGMAYLDQMETIESLPATSLQVFRKAGQDWVNNMKQREAAASTAERVDKTLTFLLLPSISTTINAFVREAENNNLARLAVAVRTFKYRFDRWPQDLTELDQLDLDPQSIETAGPESFGHQIEEAGIVLWGIERTQQATIPAKPPLVESEEDDNAPWVWRMPN